jgi:hypothetical protein
MRSKSSLESVDEVERSCPVIALSIGVVCAIPDKDGNGH